MAWGLLALVTAAAFAGAAMAGERVVEFSTDRQYSPDTVLRNLQGAPT